MRLIKSHYQMYLLAVIFCVGLSGAFAATMSTSTYAKSIPEALADLLTGKKDSPSNTISNPTSPTKNDSTNVSNPANVQSPKQPTTSALQTTAVNTSSNSTNTKSGKTQVSTKKPADTSAQVAQVASAQATKTVVPSQYATSRIADSERDTIYKASILAVAMGLVLYVLSYAKPWNWFYKNTVASSKIVAE